MGRGEIKQLGHGISYHSGFGVGDKVEVRVMGEWLLMRYIIDRFDGMSVLVSSHNRSHSLVVSIYDVRHPNLSQEVRKQYGTRS